VVGVKGEVSESGELTSVGVTCALCHSTVDDSIAPGVGRRLDGWPAKDLDIGGLLALSPAFGDEDKMALAGWGRGKYAPRHHAFDGTNLLILNTPAFPVVIPPIYGLKGVGFETYTGDGPISYWNRYVAVSQMGGQGSFSDPRIGLTITQSPDLVDPKLERLLRYQLSLHEPKPDKRSFDRAAARRGALVFFGDGGCATCHVPPTWTDVRRGPDPDVPLLHDPSEVGTEALYASRSATGMYRTTPLRALAKHPPYFHDGSAADLPAVVEHYVLQFDLALSPEQKADLVEFLKSL
jgi:hypothetical protein